MASRPGLLPFSTNGATAFSVCAWIMRNYSTAAFPRFPILHSPLFEFTGGVRGIGVNLGSGSFGPTVGTDTSSAFNASNALWVLDPEAVAAPMQAWHHFCATYDGVAGLSSVYVNGTLAAQSTRLSGSLAQLWVNNYVVIGTVSYSPIYQFTGGIACAFRDGDLAPLLPLLLLFLFLPRRLHLRVLQSFVSSEPHSRAELAVSSSSLPSPPLLPAPPLAVPAFRLYQSALSASDAASVFQEAYSCPGLVLPMAPPGPPVYSPQAAVVSSGKGYWSSSMVACTTDVSISALGYRPYGGIWPATPMNVSSTLSGTLSLTSPTALDAESGPSVAPFLYFLTVDLGGLFDVDAVTIADGGSVQGINSFFILAGNNPGPPPGYQPPSYLAHNPRCYSTSDAGSGWIGYIFSNITVPCAASAVRYVTIFVDNSVSNSTSTISKLAVFGRSSAGPVPPPPYPPPGGSAAADADALAQMGQPPAFAAQTCGPADFAYNPASPGPNSSASVLGNSGGLGDEMAAALVGGAYLDTTYGVVVFPATGQPALALPPYFWLDDGGFAMQLWVYLRGDAVRPYTKLFQFSWMDGRWDGGSFPFYQGWSALAVHSALIVDSYTIAIGFDRAHPDPQHKGTWGYCTSPTGRAVPTNEFAQIAFSVPSFNRLRTLLNNGAYVVNQDMAFVVNGERWPCTPWGGFMQNAVNVFENNLAPLLNGQSVNSGRIGSGLWSLDPPMWGFLGSAHVYLARNLSVSTLVQMFSGNFDACPPPPAPPAPDVPGLAGTNVALQAVNVWSSGTIILSGSMAYMTGFARYCGRSSCNESSLINNYPRLHGGACGNNVFGTLTQTNPMIAIDLGKQQFVSAVQLWNNNRGLEKSHLSRFIITVGDTMPPGTAYDNYLSNSYTSPGNSGVPMFTDNQVCYNQTTPVRVDPYIQVRLNAVPLWVFQSGRV